MLFKKSAISSWFFNRVEKEFSFTCFFAVSQKKNTVWLEVGTQSSYTTELQPSPPRRVYQPLYFGKIPGNTIASYFFMFFLSKTKIPSIHVLLHHTPLLKALP